MAIALVSQPVNQGSSSVVGANTITMTTPNLITPGNTLILSIYSQNNASHVPGIAVGATITDPRNNSWVPMAGVDSWISAAATGGILQMYKCVPLNAYLVGDTLSIVGQAASLSVGYQMREFSGVAQSDHPVGTFTNFGAVASTTGSLGLPITVQAAGQMVFVAGGAGTTSAITGDADTLDGSWAGVFLKTISPIDTWQQYKILSGFTSSTQTYSAGWTSTGGDNTWAQMAIVLDPTNPGGGTLTQQFPPQDNPNYACPDSGFEPLPNGNAKLPIDTGTAYQIQHTIPTYSFGTHSYSAIAQYDGTEPAIQQHHVAYDLYQAGSEVPQDAITQLTFPVGSVTIAGLQTAVPGVRVLSNDGTTVLASSTATENLSGPALAALYTAGNSMVQMNSQIPGTFVGVRFDLVNGQYNISNYPNVRILRMGIRYVAWKDNSSTVAIPSGEGIGVSYRPTMGSGTYEVEMGAWLTPDYRRSAGEQIRWLGETNPMPTIPNANSIYGPSTGAWFRTPPDVGSSWTIADLVNLSTSNPNFIRVYPYPGADVTQTVVYLDYMELVVEIAPERRLGNAIQNVSTSSVYGTGPLLASQYDPNRAAVFQLRSVRDTSIPLTVSGSPNSYQLVAREALPASTSDYYPTLASAPSAPFVAGVLPTSYAGAFLACPMEAIGPSLDFLGYTRARPMSPDQRPLTERTVVDGVFGSGATSLNQYQLSFGAVDTGNWLTVGTMFPVFQGFAPLYWQAIYQSSGANQRFYTDAAATYDQVQLVCQPDPLTTLPLTVTDLTNGRTATITVAQALAGEALGNGWFRVMTTWSATWSGSGIHQFQVSSNTPPTAPWRVATLNSAGTGPNPGLGSPLTTFEPIAGNGGITYAIEVQCTMAAISAVLGSQSVTFTPPSHNSCLTATTASIPSITLTNGSSYSWMIIERSLGTAGPWTIVKKVSAPTNGQVILDYEVPWDSPQLNAALAVNYRLTAYRNSDRRSVTTTLAWAGTSVNPGAAFALASNELNAMVLYVPVDQGDLQIKWNALNPVSYIPQHARDYQYALRIPENRGMQVDMDVEVNQFTPCLLPTSAGYSSYVTEMLTYYSEQLGAGRYAMSPRPFEVSLLPVFNSTAVWTLKLPGGHTRKVSLVVGEMTITTINGMYMSSVSMTDIPPANTNPYTVN
jgi:hypothetical protein